MRTITPIRDKVIARMIDGFGLKTTTGGLIIKEEDSSEEAIRPRWFQVTHIGPEQEEVRVGDYILMEHGRWTRGIDIEGTSHKKDFLYHIDSECMMMIADKNPLAGD